MTRGREHLPASKARAKRRRGLYLRLSLAVCALLILVGGAVALAHLRQGRIVSIAVRGTETLSPEDIRAVVSRGISGAYLYLFPKNNILLYPKKSLTAALYEAYPKLQSVDVHFKDFTTIEVEVIERQPDALWCGTAVAAAQECYFLDAKGLLYAKAPSFSGVVYVTYYGAVSSTTLLNASFLDPNTFRSLAALVAQLGTEERPVSAEISTESDATITFVSGFKLLFALHDAPEDILSRLSLARASDALKGKPFAALSYIDVRFGNKIYYKVREYK